MPEYRVVLNIETDMGDPSKWDWEELVVPYSDVERLIDVAVIPIKGG
jgi:hypothetical protein